MAPLPDFSGRMFAHRLDIIHQAFAAAGRALRELVDEQRSTLAEYEEELSAGLEPIEERDEAGHLLWSQDQVLRIQIDDAIEALQSLHKATVITAYHAWEDATRRFTGKGQGAQHLDLVRALTSRGIVAHDDLEWITLLVNTLKHGNPSKGRKLHALRPDLFWPAFNPQSEHIDWYGAIVLTSETVEIVIERLGHSGPA